jgi:hypothetical protein
VDYGTQNNGVKQEATRMGEWIKWMKKRLFILFVSDLWRTLTAQHHPVHMNYLHNTDYENQIKRMRTPHKHRIS